MFRVTVRTAGIQDVSFSHIKAFKSLCWLLSLGFQDFEPKLTLIHKNTTERITRSCFSVSSSIYLDYTRLLPSQIWIVV